MHTTEATTERSNTMDATAAIAALTDLGREAMTAIGARKVSFFDNGIEAGSGSWGECLTGELGHKSSGVINRLAKLGLFDVSRPDEGTWFSLTELGAAVANELAAPAACQHETITTPNPLTDTCVACGHILSPDEAFDHTKRTQHPDLYAACEVLVRTHRAGPQVAELMMGAVMMARRVGILRPDLTMLQIEAILAAYPADHDDTQAAARDLMYQVG